LFKYFKHIIEMKNTAFTKIHESLGAKMVPFAGFYMPVQYEGLLLNMKQ
jgi:aminomethyltransferase